MTLDQDPTFMGRVAIVSGSSITVKLAKSVDSGLSIIDGATYRIGQVGSFIRIPQGYQDLFGVVSRVGADALPATTTHGDAETGRWMEVQLVGESMGGVFERGISQYPSIGDSVHITTESTLARIYGREDFGNVTIGTLSSVESIPAILSLDELVTRHAAILGSTGSGKSTTVASLLRSIVTSNLQVGKEYPSARILLLDIHGEYSTALSDIADVYSVDPTHDHKQLCVPYWALNSTDLLGILTGEMSELGEAAFTEKIFELKVDSHNRNNFPGLNKGLMTVDTPVPFSLCRLWYDLMNNEIATFEEVDQARPAVLKEGDALNLIARQYKPHGLGSKGPFRNKNVKSILRQLNLVRSRLVDQRYNFFLRPGEWEPDLDGKVKFDLDRLLEGWIGGGKPITILDLSGAPILILEVLIGSILRIVYDSLYWSREKSEGGIERPLLIVMEEAHRYLSKSKQSLASEIVQRIAKEGRKYGVGAMVVSQRPSEVDETILSQCGTFFALRLSNPSDRARVQGTLPDGLVSLLDVLPVLRTGEAVVIGEAAKLPMRCRVALPERKQRPNSADPEVSEQWSIQRRPEGYERMIASWRAQSSRAVIDNLTIKRIPIKDA